MEDDKNLVVIEAATVAATMAASEPRIEIVGERRPAYDAAFREQVVGESHVPGVRARDLARRYNIHVSLIYRWRRIAKSGTAASSSRRSVRAKRSRPIRRLAEHPPLAFIPVGVLGLADDSARGSMGQPILVADNASNASSTSSCSMMDGQAGKIEIDLPGGIRLRVDAAVDDRALRRVLAALKTVS